MAPKNGEVKRPMESREHKNKRRENNLPAGLAKPETDMHLQWAGKTDHMPFEVTTVSPHVHNGIDPCTTIEAVPHLSSPGGRGAGGEGECERWDQGEHKAKRLPLSPELLAFARQLRQEQTDAESLLWSLLRDRRLANFKFRRQHVMAPYILDFYCHEAKLAVELDGGQHNEPDRKRQDEKRTAVLAKQGVRVVRFWNNEVLANTEGVLEAIYGAVLTLTPGPSPGGRGRMDKASISCSGNAASGPIAE